MLEHVYVTIAKEQKPSISYIVRSGVWYRLFFFFIFGVLNLSFKLRISDTRNMYTYCKYVHTKKVNFERSSNRLIHIVFSLISLQ